MIRRRGRFYWCKMSRCIAEIVWREDGQPTCFGKEGTGNVCNEPDDNFIPLPLEPVWWHICYWYNKLKSKLIGRR